MLGFDYRTSPVTMRERLGLASGDDVRRWLQAEPGPAVVLSTCHRVEIYVDDAGRLPAVARRLARESGLSEAAVRSHGARREGEACVQHLFEVAAGLQSAVTGEPQVLGQVRDALDAARSARPVGGALGVLFEQAVRVGKRVRSETSLGRTSPSLARSAVRWAIERGLRPDSARVLVVGAGAVAMLAIREAAAAGVRRLVVCARQPEVARQAARAVLRQDTAAKGAPEELSGDLARDAAVEVAPFGTLAGCLAAADLVISCTSAPGTVITAEDLERAAAGRAAPLLVVDLAVPRDVEAPERPVEGLSLAGIDDLAEAHRGEAGMPGPGDVEAAHAIVGQEVARFVEWLRHREAAPQVAAFRARAEHLRQRELDWALRRLQGELSPKGREVVKAMSRRLTNKLMHLPTLYLKEVAQRTDSTTA